MTVKARIKQVDVVYSQATITLVKYTPADIELASQLCEHFELKLGTLIRRAEAIHLLQDTPSNKDRLQEAAQHLVIMNE